MKLFLIKLFKVFAIILAGGVFVLGILAFFVTRGDPPNYSDGLGRELTVTPAFVRIFLGAERFWAGWLWSLVDLLVFIGTVAVVHSAFSLDGSKPK